MFLKIPVCLPTNEKLLKTDAKSSRWSQEPEKNVKLYKTKPVSKFLQEKFHVLVDNCNQFWTKRCYCVVRPTLLYNNQNKKKKISANCGSFFSHFDDVTPYYLVDI